MKLFFETFIICLILCFVTLFFLGGLLLSNIWAAMSFIAFLLAIWITTYIRQADRIDALEKMLAQLQQDNEPSSKD